MKLPVSEIVGDPSPNLHW